MTAIILRELMGGGQKQPQLMGKHLLSIRIREFAEYLLCASSAVSKVAHPGLKEQTGDYVIR